MSDAKRLVVKGGALVLLLSLLALALAPAPARACIWMWGVNFTYYYSTGGSCHEDCYATMTCWGDTSGYVTESYMGECYYCG